MCGRAETVQVALLGILRDLWALREGQKLMAQQDTPGNLELGL